MKRRISKQNYLHFNDTIEGERERFQYELLGILEQKLSEINHYVAGCDSPFAYLQIRAVQEHLNEIGEILGINPIIA